jgi:hypothetical protein
MIDRAFALLLMHHRSLIDWAVIEFNQLAAYLAKEKALKGLYKALRRIYNVYKRATAQATTDAIHSL